MRPRVIDTFIVDAVKDEQLSIDSAALPNGFPAGNILRYCPVVIVDPQSPQDSLPFDGLQMAGEDYEIKQLTNLHQRSFEVMHPALEKPWTDEFGNIYGSINLKGNNFSDPAIIETGTATNRLIAYGLQESSVIRRVVRASRIMRGQGIGTEYIVGLAEPQEFLWSNVDKYTDSAESVSLAEYKRRLVEKYWREMPEQERTAESLVDTASKFERMTFYISMRALDTSYRWEEMPKEAVKKEIFDHVNKYRLKPGEKEYDYRNSEDFTRYANEHFAPTIGANLAKLHLLGLAHKFPNAANVTAFGSLADLDSVHGETLDLGDEPITTQDILDDLAEVLDAIRLVNKSMPGGYNIEKTFIQAYARTVIEQLGWAEALSHLADITILANKTLANEDPNSFELSDRRSSILVLSNVLEKVVADQFFASESRQVVHIFDNWLERNLDSVTAAVGKLFESELDDYIRLTLDESIDRLNDPQFNKDRFIEELLDEEKHSLREFAFISVVGLLEAQFAEYLNSNVANEEQLAKIAQLGDPELIRLVCACLAPGEHNEIGADKVDNKLAHKLLPRLKAAIDKCWDFERPQSVLPAFKSEIALRSTDTMALLETKGVAFADLLEYLEETEDELVVKGYNNDAAARKGSYELSDESFVLTQIVSDREIDGVIYDGSYSPIKTLEYAITDNQYVLFVELKPDGNRRLILQLKDQGIVPFLQTANRHTVLTVLKHSINTQGQLFDPNQYNPARNVQLLIGD